MGKTPFWTGMKKNCSWLDDDKQTIFLSLPYENFYWELRNFHQRVFGHFESGILHFFLPLLTILIQTQSYFCFHVVHSFLVRIKVCKKQVRKYDVGAPSPITITLPGTDPADAERRRYNTYHQKTVNFAFHYK